MKQKHEQNIHIDAEFICAKCTNFLAGKQLRFCDAFITLTGYNPNKIWSRVSCLLSPAWEGALAMGGLHHCCQQG